MKLNHGEELKISKPEIGPEELDEIDELQVKKEAKEFLKSINRVYITFASMETRNYVEKLFPAKSYNKIFRVSNKMSL